MMIQQRMQPLVQATALGFSSDSIWKTGIIFNLPVVAAQSFTLVLAKFQIVFMRVDTAVVYVVAAGGGAARL